MPRGWKKNQSNSVVGRKNGRGGSSSRGRQEGSRPQGKNHQQTEMDGGIVYKSRRAVGKKNNPLIDLAEDDYMIYEEDAELDSSMDIPITSSTASNAEEEEENNTKNTNTTTSSSVGECSICCEVRPLVSLLKKCDHPPSCRECLREIYINQAQQDISNYPLQCFHPSCRRPVRETQLIQHGLLKSEEELIKHYRLTVLSKAYTSTKKVTYCPECEFPSKVNKQEIVNCRHCRTTYGVEHDEFTTKASTIAAIEAIGNDNFGHNDGWATCPNCKITISKGCGCDHMTCVCGMDFSWEDALRKKGRAQKRAKVATIKKIK
jgi:hypothetical protein